MYLLEHQDEHVWMLEQVKPLLDPPHPIHDLIILSTQVLEKELANHLSFLLRRAHQSLRHRCRTKRLAVRELWSVLLKQLIWVSK